MTAHQNHEAAPDVVSEQGHDDGGDESPDDEGVPLPLPDVAKEVPGMMAEMLDLLPAEWKAMGVEDVDTKLDEGDEEQQMERGDHMVADLRGDLIEAEDPGEHDDEQRGEAYGGVDADDHAEGEAPSEAARGYAAAHLTQQGAQDAAAEELAERSGDEHIRWDGGRRRFGCERAIGRKADRGGLSGSADS